MREALIVGLGAGTGAVLRFALSLGLLSMAGPAWPWGTFAANALGSLAIGWLAGRSLARPMPPGLRLLLVPGFCGGFTTFSIFSLEAVIMAAEAPVATFGYVLASLAAWMGAVALGFSLSRRG
ncbi:fluoride efflux transporter FluC [Pelagibacterium montanilacus]|uniref:fluoride efflux transporter FluC n=1 Tax=Pelagibacterium montanilacus TaxID=2185280 RepID=UPI000F8C7335|nr:CrcB family protein [Pelagibacterium montanilacus]